MLEHASSCGVDTDAALRELELHRDDIVFERRLPAATLRRAWIDVPALAGDPSFGLHVAERAACGAYDVLGYAFHFSETLGEGIDRLRRFHRVLSDTLEIELTVDGPTARLRQVQKLPRHEAEAHIASIVLAARTHTRVAIDLREVRFAHAAPAHTAHHARSSGHR